MIVVDASVLVEVLLQLPAGEAVMSRVSGEEGGFHAPHLIDVEVANVLRRLVLAGRLAARRGWEALVDLSGFPLTRYPHTELVQRGWALRENVTAYDGVYVGLAGMLGAPLLTRDRRLAAAVEGRVVVEVV